MSEENTQQAPQEENTVGENNVVEEVNEEEYDGIFH